MADTKESGDDRWRETLSEVRRFWRAMPDKWLFFSLLGAWAVLFHWFGNGTFGYVDSPSLFLWLERIYSSSDDDAHGRLIPFVVLVVLFLKREELIQAEKRLYLPALGLLLGAVALHLAGFMIQQTRVSVVAFFVGIYALTGLVWGPVWLRRTFFPFFLFAFCLPISVFSERITFPMRLWVSAASAEIAGFLGIDVTRVGTQLIGSGGAQFDVAAACSGIRSLTALLTISTIYAFMTFRSGWRRALIVLAIFPLTVLGNTVRITGVILVSEAFGDRWENAAMTFHDYAGFITFLVALGIMLGLGALLRERGGEASSDDKNDQTKTDNSRGNPVTAGGGGGVSPDLGPKPETGIARGDA